MRSVTVSFPSKHGYDIILKNSFEELKNYISKNRRYFVITDENVEALYFNEFKRIVFDKDVDHHIIGSGEINKNIVSVNECYRALIKNNHDRKSVIIALGGGVVGDIAGFVASTYMRGIEYIQIPTTLLSMVDSSVGGKTGYDFEGAKNIIGAFYQPSLVYADISCLKTLPIREFNTGMAECIKHALIYDNEYYEFIKKNKQEIKELKYDHLLHLVEKSCEIKAGVVALDEKENGIRALLNFGHTIGHAIEAASSYDLTHGESVSIGINAAVYESCISADEKKDIQKLLGFFDLPLFYEGDISKISHYLKMDKKFKNNKFNFILLNKIGSAYIKTYHDIKDIIKIAGYITK